MFSAWCTAGLGTRRNLTAGAVRRTALGENFRPVRCVRLRWAGIVDWCTAVRNRVHQAKNIAAILAPECTTRDTLTSPGFRSAPSETSCPAPGSGAHRAQIKSYPGPCVQSVTMWLGFPRSFVCRCEQKVSYKSCSPSMCVHVATECLHCANIAVLRFCLWIS